MKSVIKESEILRSAISSLQSISGAIIKQLPISRISKKNADAVVEIGLPKTHQELHVQIKGEVREHLIKEMMEDFGKQKNQWLLVAKYIPGPLKEFLKTHGYNYLESTGNCYISTDSLFINISNKEVKNVLKTPEGKLWKATGLKFLFVILQDPKMLKHSHRAIAEAAGIASGNISYFLQELKQGGYLSMNDQEEQLQHREKLIDRWVEAFHITLKPKLQRIVLKFQNIDKQLAWRDIKLPGLYWGGEPGGDIYTNFLKPEIFTIYSSLPTVDLLKNLRLMPDNNGNVFVLEKFWKEQTFEKEIPHAAPLLLVYADLKNSLDSRNWETAVSIKKMLLQAK